MRETDLAGVQACVFDAYGTLFDVNAAARGCAEALGETWPAFAELWRGRQLQYSWLRGLSGRHTPFWQVTQDALDHALDAFGRSGETRLRQELLDLYFQLGVYPEVAEMLGRLKAAGLRTAILSNGSRDMLDAAVDSAGIGGLLDAVISVDEVGVFKPHPSVYDLPVRAFGLAPDRMSFQSSNGWDAWSASAHGYRVVWVNRQGQAPERLPGQPDHVVRDLSALPRLLGLDT